MNNWKKEYLRDKIIRIHAWYGHIPTPTTITPSRTTNVSSLASVELEQLGFHKASYSEPRTRNLTKVLVELPDVVEQFQ